MNKTKQDKLDMLDMFATAALQALISKMPLYDIKGEYGKEITEKEIQIIKRTITLTAYEYAEWMMIAREDGKKWLKQTIEANPDFGSD